MFKIVDRKEMADGSIIMNQIEAPRIVAKAKPGQFVILKANETGERVPLTISDLDAEKGTIAGICQVVGQSTPMFQAVDCGDAYQDVTGPPGKPTAIEKLGHVVFGGGGTGIAVLFPITRGFKNAGNQVTSIIGARTKDLLILEDKMKGVSDKLRVCTDDGSYGTKGFVTDALKDVLENSRVDLVVAIGPVPMMKFVSALTREYDVRTLVSLNPIMIDGTGMCGCCRVTVGDETKFACVDGPEFDGHLVDFDGLIQRLRAYEEQEKEAYNNYCATMGNQ